MSTRQTSIFLVLAGSAPDLAFADAANAHAYCDAKNALNKKAVEQGFANLTYYHWVEVKLLRKLP